MDASVSLHDATERSAILLVLRLRHLLSVSARSRAYVRATRNKSRSMFRVQLMHLTFGSGVSRERVASVGCAALLWQAPWLVEVILRRPLTRVE